MSLPGFEPEHAPEISDKLRDKAESIWATLQAFHVGRARAVKAPELARAFALKSAEVRSCIHFLRRSVLVSSDAAGYYVPETRAEAEVTIAHLSARARSVQAVADKQAALAEVLFPVKHSPAQAIDKTLSKSYI